MIVAGLRLMIGIGIGCVFLLFAAVVASFIIFRFERLAYQRGWREEPIRSMPEVRANSVVPFGLRRSARSPYRRKAEK